MTQRQARKLAEDRLAPLNQNKLLPQSILAFGDFVERYFAPLILPTSPPARWCFRHFDGHEDWEILGLRRKDVNFVTGEIRIEQANYRGLFGTPKTKGSKRSLPIPKALAFPLARTCGHYGQIEDETLVFRTRNGTPHSDRNLLHRDLKPTGAKIGVPWLNWHTLRRTHATLLQSAGASLRDAQVQLGHSKMSTTLEVYTVPIPAHLREAVENLSRLVTNGDEFGQRAEELLTVVQ